MGREALRKPYTSCQAEAETLCGRKTSLLGTLMLGLSTLLGSFSGCGGFFPSEHLRGAFIWGKLCLTDSSLPHIMSSA
jgi:hypothetical protein